MDKYLDKAVDFLVKTFDKPWLSLAVGVGGVVAVFLIALMLSITVGDFNRCRRACRSIGKGNIKKGMYKLQRQAPVYDKRVAIAPEADAFDFDRILGSTYSYSLVRRLPSVVMIATMFFTSLAIALTFYAPMPSSYGITLFNSYSALNLIATGVTGFVFYIIAMIVAAAALKSASRRYYIMLDVISGSSRTALDSTVVSRQAQVPQRPSPQPAMQRPARPVQPQSQVVTEEMELSPEAQEIIDKVKDIALTGGADLETIKNLFRRLELEKDNPQNQNPFALSQINKAASVINRMLDTL